MEESTAKRTSEEVVDNENELIIKFKKPYFFEGKNYNEIDLSGLENLTGNDMIQVNKTLQKSGGFSLVPEMTLEYAQEIAARVTEQPIEFFRGLSLKNSIILKNTVSNFMFGEE